jgi:hypothetical protein
MSAEDVTFTTPSTRVERHHQRRMRIRRTLELETIGFMRARLYQ